MLSIIFDAVLFCSFLVGPVWLYDRYCTWREGKR